MTKIYIVWASWDEHGLLVSEDCGIFTNKKSADDKLNKIYCQSDGVDKKEGEYLFEADYCCVLEYELNDQGEYKEVEGENNEKYNSVCFLERGFSVNHPEEDPYYEDGFWVTGQVRENLEKLFNEYRSMSDEELLSALSFTDTVEGETE